MICTACVTPTQNNLGEDGSTSGATEGETSVGPATSSATMSTGSSGATVSTTDTDVTTEPTSMGSTDASGGAVCGDGMIEGAEVCDDGVNDGSYGGCATDCMALGPHCGDAAVQRGEGEVCDDGDEVDGNGCNVDCIESGTVLWTATYSSDEGESLDVAMDVAVDGDGTALVVGQFLDTGLGNPPLGSLLVWYDAAGDELAASDSPAVYIAGAFGGPGYVLLEDYDADTEQSAVAGFDATRSQVWRRVFMGSGVRAIAVDGDDAVFVAGSRIEGTAPFYTHDPLLGRLDGDGSVIWQDIDTADSGICFDVALLEGVGLLYRCAGYTRWVDVDGGELTRLEQDAGVIDTRPDGTYAGATDTDVRGYDEAGAEQWSVPGFSANDIAIDGAGNIIVVGNENDDIAIAKYTADGEELWTDLYSEDEPASARGVAIAPDDTIVVAATVERFAAGQGADIWVRKYAP